MSTDRTPKSFLDSFGELRRALWLVVWRAFAKLDVGPTQVVLIRTLIGQEGMSQCALARATATDPSALSRTVNGLVACGWIERRRSEVDRREFVVSLTALGRRMGARLEEAHRCAEELVTAPLDARDRADFERIAAKLTALGSSLDTDAGSADERRPAPPPCLGGIGKAGKADGIPRAPAASAPRKPRSTAAARAGKLPRAAPAPRPRKK